MITARARRYGICALNAALAIVFAHEIATTDADEFLGEQDNEKLVQLSNYLHGGKSCPWDKYDFVGIPIIRHNICDH